MHKTNKRINCHQILCRVHIAQVIFRVMICSVVAVMLQCCGMQFQWITTIEMKRIEFNGGFRSAGTRRAETGFKPEI